MPVYYYANVIYQFSHALPLYEKYKGTFVVKNLKNYYWFKRYLKNTARFGEKTLFKARTVRCRAISCGVRGIRIGEPDRIVRFQRAGA